MNEELDEMIAILTSIQKHNREIYLLALRAKTMCPDMTHWENNQTYELRAVLSSVSNYRSDTTENDIKRVLRQLEAQKAQLVKEEEANAAR